MSKKKHDVPEELLAGLLASYKNPEDLIGEEGLVKHLTKLVVERALEAELSEHLGHDKHGSVANDTGNTRNGKSRKTLKGEFGAVHRSYGSIQSELRFVETTPGSGGRPSIDLPVGHRRRGKSQMGRQKSIDRFAVVADELVANAIFPPMGQANVVYVSHDTCKVRLVLDERNDGLQEDVLRLSPGL